MELMVIMLMGGKGGGGGGGGGGARWPLSCLALLVSLTRMSNSSRIGSAAW